MQISYDTASAECLVCGLHAPRMIPEDEGSEIQVAGDTCLRCGSRDIRADPAGHDTLES
jgi:hypothetical protein